MVIPSEHTSSSPRCIQEGELVIVYESFNAAKAVTVEPKGHYQNRFGSFFHKDWVGLPYGSKVYCRGSSRAWVHLLAPTPELWTLVLRHRTQILYLADISMVVSHLDLRPGAVVLESGTGSGSLTHSLARAVAPTGHVHTFEFHPLRAAEAAKEFQDHGLSGLITVTQRNIEEAGFPVEQLAGTATGVFLDLPAPWKVVPSAAACLQPDGRFCAFSPCIEQVLRTVEELDAHGFTDITTLECLLRNYDVFKQDLGLLTSSSGAAAAAADPEAAAWAQGAGVEAAAEQAALAQQEQQQEEAGANGEEPPAKRSRRGQDSAVKAAAAAAAPVVAAAAVTAAAPPAAAGCVLEDELDALYDKQQQQQEEDPEGEAGGEGGQEGSAGGAADSDTQGAPPASRGSTPTTAAAAAVGSSKPGRPNQGKQGGQGGRAKRHVLPPLPCVSVVVARPAMEARGHTGYLTFARKWVAP